MIIDFMFQLTKEEFDNLRFHFGTSSWKSWGPNWKNRDSGVVEKPIFKEIIPINFPSRVNAGWEGPVLLRPAFTRDEGGTKGRVILLGFFTEIVHPHLYPPPSKGEEHTFSTPHSARF